MAFKQITSHSLAMSKNRYERRWQRENGANMTVDAASYNNQFLLFISWLFILSSLIVGTRTDIIYKFYKNNKYFYHVFDDFLDLKWRNSNLKFVVY